MKMFALSLALSIASLCAAQAAPDKSAPTAKLTSGAKIFIEPMEGFEASVAAAFIKKQVPVRIVDDRSKADFIFMGYAKEEKAGWAKTIFISSAPHAEASVEIKDAHTGDMVWAYNVDKPNAARATQSTAEACAKHLKQFIDKNEK